MRNLKKVLALVIAFSMMLSVVAFASFNDVAADADYAGAVELLSALDIIVGDDLGNFNPDKTISRAEMAAIVCRIKGLEASANAAKGATNFSDVAADHWASGYVNVANQNGIVAGKGDGTFGPEEEVSYEAAVKMVVSALGFEPMAAQKGGWPTGYLVVANTYKISEGVSGSTRADVAVLVSNALSTPMMDQTTYGADAEFEILDGKKDRDYRTLLTDMDIYVATGIVMDTDKAEGEAYFTVTEDSDDLEFEKADEATFEINGSNIADYQFQNVDVYVEKDARKDYNVVAVVPGVIGETFALLSDDIKATSGAVIEYYVDAANSSKTKEIKLNADKDGNVDVSVVYNKTLQNPAEDTDYDVEEIAAMDDVELVFIENTGDTKYDVVVATKYLSALVASVEASRDRIEIKSGSDSYTITFDFEEEEDTIILCDDAGAELTLEDFAEDDVVAVVADNDNPKKYVDYIKVIKLSNAAVTGVVEEAYTSNGDAYIVVDGNEMKVDTAAVGTLNVSDEGIFYVGMTGKVIYFDGDAAGKNYAYILESAKEDSAFAADIVQVKLLTKDEGVVIYDLTEDASEEFVKAENYGKADAFDWTTPVSDASRLITYKTNAKGQIKSITPVASASYKTVNGEFNAKTQAVDGKNVEDDVIVFVVGEDKADNTYVAGLSYLVDDGAYVGDAYMDEKGEYSVLVITEGDSAFSEETGLAIVTKVTQTKNAEEDDIIKISYVQGEEEGSVIIDEDSTNKTSVVIDESSDINVGDVFAFNATADGTATQYAVIAQMKVTGQDANGKDVYEMSLVSEIKDQAKVKKLFGEDTNIVLSYIANDKKASTSRFENITLGDKWNEEDDIVSVSSDSYRYTFDNSGRNIVIETGDFMATDFTDYYDAENKLATPVLVRLYDGSVVDIYTANDRISK